MVEKKGSYKKVTRKQTIIAFTHASPISDIGDKSWIFANKDCFKINMYFSLEQSFVSKQQCRNNLECTNYTVTKLNTPPYYDKFSYKL